MWIRPGAFPKFLRGKPLQILTYAFQATVRRTSRNSCTTCRTLLELLRSMALGLGRKGHRRAGVLTGKVCVLAGQPAQHHTAWRAHSRIKIGVASKHTRLSTTCHRQHIFCTNDATYSQTARGDEPTRGCEAPLERRVRLQGQ